MIRGSDNDQKRKDDYKENSSHHVPLGNFDVEFGNLRIETFLINFVKGGESEEDFIQEIKTDI